MDFPVYVPEAVRKQIAHYLDGEPERGIPGYVELRDRESKELSRIEGAMGVKIRRGEDEYLPSLRRQRAETAEQHAMLDRDVQRLQRLALDPRMRDAFAALELEQLGDAQLRGFIHAAWSACIDFSVFRARHRRAKELATKIAGAADELQSLIHQFSGLGLSGPQEFYSIPALLQGADNHDMQDHNLHMWRRMRRHVLGDPTAASSAEQSRDAQSADFLRYAWGTAPDFSALLVPLSAAARAYGPEQSGFIGAGLNSRKSTPKTAYIRALAALLRDQYGLTLSARVKQAMAITATVVLNDPDDPVTTSDVSSAVSRGTD